MHKILLVEDNEINRDMLTRRLQRHGFSVCCAHDGATGVEMAVSEMPDLILMDVALGEMDGWEATQLIKANPATSAIPIVALTAHWPAIATRASRSDVPTSIRNRSICSDCWEKFEAVCRPQRAKTLSPD
jgi:CheY-like chemotaxis protein